MTTASTVVTAAVEDGAGEDAYEVRTAIRWDSQGDETALEPIQWKGGQAPVDKLALGCPAGFESRGGVVGVDCAPCPPDTYKADRSPERCQRCPELTIQPRTGSTACLCKAGHVDVSNATEAIACALCPLGAICTASGVELASMRLSPGYWRPSAGSVDVRQCLDAAINAATNCSSANECESYLLRFRPSGAAFSCPFRCAGLCAAS